MGHVVELRDVELSFGDKEVLDDVSLVFAFIMKLAT
jgi:ABC-type transporter Mla maintaining outer membrane lipid asymmetry ATPase subunit MlaF